MSEAIVRPLLILYTTSGCHLCEQAEWILRNQLSAIELQLQDIVESQDLMAQYGIRIPVVRLAGADADLGWPFSAEDVADYLDAELP